MTTCRINSVRWNGPGQLEVPPQSSLSYFRAIGSGRDPGGALRGGQPGAGHPHRRLLNLGDAAVVLLRHTRLRTVRLLGILALWGKIEREKKWRVSTGEEEGAVKAVEGGTMAGEEWRVKNGVILMIDSTCSMYSNVLPWLCERKRRVL